MNTHVTTYFLAWHEGKLDAVRRTAVEKHLRECGSCSRFYDAAASAVSPIKQHAESFPIADPYLPTRVRAIVEEGKQGWHPAGIPVLRFSLGTAMLMIAIVFGIELGNG